MQKYLVVHGDEPENFLCQADDPAHAVEQCKAAAGDDTAIAHVYQLIEVSCDGPETLGSIIQEMQAAGPMVTLSFRPQAWVRDNAIGVDIDHDPTWQIPLTEFLAEFPMREHWEEHADARDVLREDSRAPEWVQNWSGPFEVDLAPAEDPWGEEEEVDDKGGCNVSGGHEPAYDEHGKGICRYCGQEVE